MRILVAPDKFRGTLTAIQAAHAIETGWSRTHPDDRIDVAPMADGGEGTLEALVDGPGGATFEAEVRGPLGDRVRARFGVLESAESRTAVIEMARASGLQLLPAGRRVPRITTTRGTGDLIRAALEHEPSAVVVCIGGSATNDGGVGMAQALGGRFLDERDEEIGPGGAELLRLRRIDLRPLTLLVGDHLSFVAASDVDNPLCGPSGASVVYGPQKGADPDDVLLLDRALGHLAAVVRSDLGIELADEPGAGAAGGLGFGLMAFLGARLRPGVQVVMDALGLQGRIEGADLVITGEGKVDEQSLRGKVVAGVVGTARDAGVAAAVLCGRAEVDIDGATVGSLVDRFGEAAAMAETRTSLETLAQELAVGYEGSP